MRDIMGLMKQVQSAQAKLQEMQAEMETVEVEGEAGGGLVKISTQRQGRDEGRLYRSKPVEARGQ